MQPKVVFMGTPEFSVPALEAIASRIGSADLLVVTQPDRAAGRGRRLQAPPVKEAAERLGLQTMQVETLREPTARERLEGFHPELIIVAAFGLILPKWVLGLPRRGCVNLHASELPRFRGASPIAAAIACGDAHTGVALMEMEAGLDTGGVYDRRIIDISAHDTTESLTQGLSRVGASLVGERLDDLLAGRLVPHPQRGHIVETRKITKAHGAIDWRLPAKKIERHVRAMWSWPRAWTVGPNDVRVQVHVSELAAGSGVPGTVISHEGGVVVAAGDGALRLTVVQLAGKAAQAASELEGHPVFAIGSTLSRGDGFVEPAPWIMDAGEA